MKTVILKCPSCGSGLEITPDLDQFACSYCGTEQIVQRNGGVIVLKLLTEAIGNVQRGTDATAAELAIQRLEGDLAKTEQERILLELRIAKARREAFTFGSIVFVGLLLVSLYLYSGDRAGWAFIVGVFAFILTGIIVTVSTSNERSKAKRRV